MGTLDGKVAFVTGAGSGIGRGIAERLAREGADVAVCDVDLDAARGTGERVQAAGRKAHVVKANVASPRQIQEAVEAAAGALGRLDIAIANAGIARAGGVLDFGLKEWQDQLDVNLTGVFLTVQAAARRMVQAGRGGRIVCTASLAAEITSPLMFGYSASKAAVRMMVRGWAQELGRFGITVNAIGPGVIDTPLARALAGGEGGPIRKALEERTPLGRVGTTADIAGPVAFLCGPDGGFITGTYMIIDGGLRDSGNQFLDLGDPAQLGELQQLMTEGIQHQARLQKLIDERS
jgi:NAD(P)-dependent dehydrogenase (short-subunit alcohol dehydrogenase family)